jgi:hypothetical protein
MIPIRLIISIAIVAAIFLMVAFGFMYLRVVLAENQVENSCATLEGKILTMLSSGIPRDVDEIGAGDGTKRIHSLDLPDNLIFLAFGVDPDSDNDGIYETGLTENGAAIFYKIEGGSKKVIWLNKDFKFREGKYDGDKWILNDGGQGYIITSIGEQTLNFELVEKSSLTYILIHANDNIEIL